MGRWTDGRVQRIEVDEDLQKRRSSCKPANAGGHDQMACQAMIRERRHTPYIAEMKMVRPNNMPGKAMSRHQRGPPRVKLAMRGGILEGIDVSSVGDV